MVVVPMFVMPPLSVDGIDVHRAAAILGQAAAIGVRKLVAAAAYGNIAVVIPNQVAA